MSPETLREVIEAVQQLGGEAKEAFIWYLITAHLPAFVIGLVWTGIGGLAIFAVIRLLRCIVNMVSRSEQLRQATGKREYDWRQSDVDEALEVVRRHYKKGTEQ